MIGVNVDALQTTGDDEGLDNAYVLGAELGPAEVSSSCGPWERLSTRVRVGWHRVVRRGRSGTLPVPLARVIQGIDEWCCSPCRRVASPVSLRRHGSPPLTQYGATKRSETACAVDRARAQGVTKRTLRGARELPLAAS